MDLLMTRSFNGVQLDCYRADNANDVFWVTRGQIGRLLEYGNPDTAIKNIHIRNADRLDKFSTQLKLSQVEGNRMVTREVIVYNFKGLLEICRYSNQPKANAVMMDTGKKHSNGTPIRQLKWETPIVEEVKKLMPRK